MARRFWTDREVEYLKNYWGTRSIEQIARYTHRTCDAVSIKAYKLGLPNMSDSVPGIPMSMLGELVGRSYPVVRKSWVRAGLKTNKCGKGIAYVVEKDLVDFMQAHPNLWDARECDYYYFYKYSWFIEALENERNGNHAARYHRWTEQEKAKFIYMREKKAMYFKEIGEVYGISGKCANKLYLSWKRKKKVSEV